jgi:hypothetical protein
VFHEPLKLNTALAKSPTCRVKTQNNQVFMSVNAAFKRDHLNLEHHLNHSALRAKMFLKAQQRSYTER